MVFNTNLTKVKAVLFGSLKESFILLPLFFIAIFIGVLIETQISSTIIQTIFADNWLIAIPVLAIITSIIPLPRYIDYPIAFSLLLSGAGYGTIFVIISAESIGGIVRNITESKYLGYKFTIIRTILSIILITIGGFILEVVL